MLEGVRRHTTGITHTARMTQHNLEQMSWQYLRALTELFAIAKDIKYIMVQS